MYFQVSTFCVEWEEYGVEDMEYGIWNIFCLVLYLRKELIHSCRNTFHYDLDSISTMRPSPPPSFVAVIVE
jgi:hypothetical protein